MEQELRQGKILTMEQSLNLQKRHLKTIQHGSEYDMSNEDECIMHANFIVSLGNNYMGREFRSFELDDNNKKVLRFLLYYFNGSQFAESVFPDEDYRIHKNLLLIGDPGTGKTIIMQIFSDYLQLTQNPNYFLNMSVTQMMNYYKINGHIDRYTYNELAGGNTDGKPMNVCLNDIGLETENQKSYGTSLDSVINEFLYARYEIYQQYSIKYHITSNLTVKEFKNRFGNRLVDRFKGFNVITLTGESRRK